VLSAVGRQSSVALAVLRSTLLMYSFTPSLVSVKFVRFHVGVKNSDSFIRGARASAKVNASVFRSGRM
jgi:hypothetical protein